MDFNFSDEQRLLSESVQRFVREQYTFEKRREYLHAEEDKSVWAALAELGLTAINVPETYGGLGGGAIETLLAMNALGQGLVLEPYIESAVLAPVLLSQFEGRIAAELLPVIATGERFVAFAHEEPSSRGSLGYVQSRAKKEGQEYVLDGYKCVVGYGARAQDLVVSARLSGNPTDEHGIGLFRVDPASPGVRVIGYRTLDGRRAADIELKSVSIDATRCLSEDAFLQIEAACDIALSAVCAEAVGIMNAVNVMTLEYLKNRKQFGQPIGRFQVLQHRMADMYIHAEQATSMSYLAAVRCTDPDRVERRKALSAAKVLIGQSGRFIAQQAIQLHGGMGMTDEMLVSHYFKRLTAIEFMLGDCDTHLRQVIAAW